jgi:hypothetical protein
MSDDSGSPSEGFSEDGEVLNKIWRVKEGRKNLISVVCARKIGCLLPASERFLSEKLSAPCTVSEEKSQLRL